MTTQQFPQFETELKELITRYSIEAITFFSFFSDEGQPRGGSHIFISANCPDVYEFMAQYVLQAGYDSMSGIPSAYVVEIRHDVGTGISQDPDKN